MGATSQQDTLTQEQEAQRQAEIYFGHSRAIGYAQANLLATLGVHPHKAAHAGLHEAMCAIDGMAKQDRQAAAMTANEIAQTFIAFCDHLGFNEGQNGAQAAE
jgi:hypothetical protein